jgi:hypothetical protein
MMHKHQKNIMDHLMDRQNSSDSQDDDRKCVGRAVNEEVAGSNPAPATNYTCDVGWMLNLAGVDGYQRSQD